MVFLDIIKKDVQAIIAAGGTDADVEDYLGGKNVISEPQGSMLQQMMGAFHERGQRRKEQLGGRNLSQFEEEWIEKHGQPVGTGAYGLRMRGELSEAAEGFKQIPQAISAIREAPGAAGKAILQEMGTSMGASITHPIVSFGAPLEHSLNIAALLGVGAKAAQAGKAVGKIPAVAKGAKKVGEVAGKVGANIKGGQGRAIAMAVGAKPEQGIRATTRAPQVFTKANLADDAWHTVGKSVQAKVKKADLLNAKAVHVETETLKALPKNLRLNNIDIVDDITKRMNDVLYKTVKGRKAGIPSAQMNKVKYYLRELKKPMTVEKAHKIKHEIQRLLKPKYDKQGIAISTVTDDEAFKLLNSIQGQLNEKLRLISPKYKKVNLRFKALRDAYGELGKNKIDSTTVGRNIKNLMTSKDPNLVTPYRELLQQLDEAMPKGLKFMDDLLDVETAQAFKPWIRTQQLMPIAAKGGTLTGAAGVGTLTGIMTGSVPLGIAAGVGTGIATSPRVHGAALRAGMTMAQKARGVGRGIGMAGAKLSKSPAMWTGYGGLQTGRGLREISR